MDFDFIRPKLEVFVDHVCEIGEEDFTEEDCEVKEVFTPSNPYRVLSDDSLYAEQIFTPAKSGCASY